MSQYTKNTLEIPRQCFKYNDAYEQVATEQNTFTPVTHFRWNKGIFMYLEGAEQPQRNITSPETMWAINLAKKTFVHGIKLFSKWWFLPSYLIVAFLPFKRKVKVLEGFINAFLDINWKNMSPYIMLTEMMTESCQEVEWACYTTLNNLGFAPRVCEQFGEVISAMIDYDNAYRLRFEDIMEEASKEALLKNPAKELKRLLVIYGERQGKGRKNDMYMKASRVIWLLRVMLLHPRFKKLFLQTIQEIDIKKMGFGVEDRYWVCLRSNEYLFMGKTQEEREKLITQKPKLIKR
jgi:hypothetical protein